MTLLQQFAEVIQDDTTVCMMIGHGAKNQFRSITELRKVLRDVASKIPEGGVVLYFGDYPDKSRPDIGYAFTLLSKARPDITFKMIQIEEAKSWGHPEFVKENNIYWHTDYTKKHKWGGFNDANKPQSNTKQWVKLHKLLQSKGHRGICNAFVLGGGPIAFQEAKYAKRLGIPTVVYPIERRYKGDGNTKISPNDSRDERYGPVAYKNRV